MLSFVGVAGQADGGTAVRCSDPDIICQTRTLVRPPLHLLSGLPASPPPPCLGKPLRMTPPPVMSCGLHHPAPLPPPFSCTGAGGASACVPEGSWESQSGHQTLLCDAVRVSKLCCADRAHVHAHTRAQNTQHTCTRTQQLDVALC